MEKAELLGKFQRLGKVLMAPVLILPVAGILVGLGNAFTSSSLLKILGWDCRQLVFSSQSARLRETLLWAISQSSSPYAWPMDLQSLKRQLQHSVGFWVI